MNRGLSTYPMYDWVVSYEPTKGCCKSLTNRLPDRLGCTSGMARDLKDGALPPLLGSTARVALEVPAILLKWVRWIWELNGF